MEIEQLSTSGVEVPDTACCPCCNGATLATFLCAIKDLRFVGWDDALLLDGQSELKRIEFRSSLLLSNENSEKAILLIERIDWEVPGRYVPFTFVCDLRVARVLLRNWFPAFARGISRAFECPDDIDLFDLKFRKCDLFSLSTSISSIVIGADPCPLAFDTNFLSLWFHKNSSPILWTKIQSSPLFTKKIAPSRVLLLVVMYACVSVCCDVSTNVSVSFKFSFFFACFL